MSYGVVEELPLLRAKRGTTEGATGPDVGPGTYYTDFKPIPNHSRAPFNSTSLRPPLSTTDRSVPGPGTYEEAPYYKGYRGEASRCPFISDVSRFPTESADIPPGPGDYEVANNWYTKKNPRVHEFAAPYEAVSDVQKADVVGPGTYNPNIAAASRKNPKAAHFSKYSKRDQPKLETYPGPGAYDINKTPKSIAAQKPSSMFATRTKRSLDLLGAGDTPGPGSYDIDKKATGRSAVPQEHFSAFGTSAGRFPLTRDENPVGPGSYTGEIAPRRFYPTASNGSAAFVSGSDRFPVVPRDAQGQRTYDGQRLPRRKLFGQSMPFGCTVPRFGAVWSQRPQPLLLDFDDLDNPSQPHYRRRGRPFIVGDIHPSSAPPPLPERLYNVKYDWPKPTTMRESTFDQEPRLHGLHAKASDSPGPGHYLGNGVLPPHSNRFGNSSWSRDIRFFDNPTTGNPGAGSYYHDSTFLKRTYNVTIGSDATWIQH